MDEIEDRRRSGDLDEGLRIARGRRVEVGRFHRHRMDLRPHRLTLCEQARATGGSGSGRRDRRARSARPPAARGRCSHGTSSELNARSIAHGVRPPLTATTKRPRACTAARASSAMTSAARRATDSASASTSRFITCHELLVRSSCRSCGSAGSARWSSCRDSAAARALPPSSGMIRCASTFPSSTPHWSNESMFQITPCVNTMCS